jgi:hypothetical protein
MNRKPLEEQWAILGKELAGLRHLVASNASDTRTLEHFNEALLANEFEIALHALCDCLLAVPAPRISDDEIGTIDQLHTRMKLTDDCVDAIRRKR